MTFTPYVPPSSLSSLPSGIWAGVQGLNVFPYLPGQNIDVTKTPMWSTEVIKSASGRRRSTRYYPYPLWQFDVSYEVLRKTGAPSNPTTDELMKMWEFFNLQAGQSGTFLMVDPTDCVIPSSAPAAFGTGDGVTQVFQLQRQINSWSEPVYDVYQPVIYDNGTVTGSTLAYSPNGVVTFGTAPAAGHALTWSGYFYFGCCFLQDDLSFIQIVQALWNGKGLKMESQPA